MIWLSGVNSILPLSGAFGGVLGAGLVFLMRQLIHIICFKTLSLSFLALCVPGFCASLYWVQPSPHPSLKATEGTARLRRTSSPIESLFVHVLHLLLPIACMALFIAHPVGSQAFIYSFYWLIPVVLYFIPHRSLFLTALGSTFIAHAVGSVIWCYTVPMTAGMWMGLLPIVALERTLFALGMVVAHHMISFIFKMIDDIALRNISAQNQLAICKK
jgi:hypothetical protein